MTGANVLEFILECPICGEEVSDFWEGYCEDCFADREGALVLHNSQYDYWNSLTDKEKEDNIRWSSNHYG